MSPAAEADMVWLKSTLTGLVAAIIAVVAIVVATTSWHMSVGQGSGGIGFVTFGLSELLLFPAALAFALAFRWMFRRQQRSLTRPTRPTSPTTPTRIAP